MAIWQIPLLVENVAVHNQLQCKFWNAECNNKVHDGSPLQELQEENQLAERFTNIMVFPLW
jgi:hypothetical protein